MKTTKLVVIKMQKAYSITFLLILFLVPTIFATNSNKYFKNICKSSRIPVKKVVGKHLDYISLAFTGDTQFARKI